MAAVPVSHKYQDAHKLPNGPGDARPTAKQIIIDENLVGKWPDKVILITGCSSGIGVETARALHLTGAHLFLTVRDPAKSEETVKGILDSNRGVSSGKIDLLKLELDSLDSVRECVKEFLARSKQLHVLITNAGVMACPQSYTKDGFETQFGVNHLGHFLLFHLLRPTLLASSTPSFPSRVVALASMGHRLSPLRFDDLHFKSTPYDAWVAYGQSKTANVSFAFELERRYGAQGLHAWSVHPGVIFTQLARHMDEASKKVFNDPDLLKRLKSAEQGAATTVWAAVSTELQGAGGKYLEDVSIAGPKQGKAVELVTELRGPGYAPHAYDVDAARRLWEYSLEATGCK